MLGLFLRKENIYLNIYGRNLQYCWGILLLCIISEATVFRWLFCQRVVLFVAAACGYKEQTSEAQGGDGKLKYALFT